MSVTVMPNAGYCMFVLLLFYIYSIRLSAMSKFFAEIKWFFGALLAACMLSFLFLLFVRISFQQGEAPPFFTVKKYLAGIAVMLGSIYSVRWMVGAIKSSLLG
jgi:hypothetical protein